MNRVIITFTTDEIGDTPNSPCFVNATPKAEKDFFITHHSQNFDCYFKTAGRHENLLFMRSDTFPCSYKEKPMLQP